jgi:transposase InsO family protein
VAADLVRRDFFENGPNDLWVTDITEHPTKEGKAFCCAVLDAFSRKVVGWSIDSTQTAALVTNAPGMAIRGRAPDCTVIHGDRRHSIYALDLYPTRERGGADAVGRSHRDGPRQRDDGAVLGSDEGRAAQPPAMEDEGRDDLGGSLSPGEQ